MSTLPSPSQALSPQAVSRAFLGVSLGAALLYILRAAPTAWLLDSSELVATVNDLGVSHPPGHPAFALLHAALLGLPLGNMAFRMHLASALLTAAALGLIPVMAWRLGWLQSRLQLTAVALLALGFAASPIFAGQAIRAEVYPLHLFVVAAASCLVFPYSHASSPDARVRHAGLLAVLLGVGLLNHHYLSFFACPAFALALLGPAGGRRLRRLLVGCAGGLVTLAGYLYLPVASAHRPIASWGWPTTADDILWAVSAQAFQKTATKATTMDPVAGLENVLGLLMECMSLPGFFVAAGGLAFLLLRERWTGLLLLLAISLNLMTQFLFDFDPTNPDVLGYFMSGLWWLILPAAWLLSQLTALPQAPPLNGALWKRTLVVALGLAWVAFMSSDRGSTRTLNLASNWDSELLRDEALDLIAPGGVWITGYYETAFNTWYAQRVEDRRPDVAHIHLPFLTWPFYGPQLQAQGFTAEQVTALATLEAGPLLELAAERDLRIEAELLVPQEIAASALPERLYLQVHAEGLPEGPFPANIHEMAVNGVRAARARFGATPELQAARNLVWNHYNLAVQMCRAGRLETCAALAELALELSPNDPELFNLRGAAQERLELEHRR